MKKLILSIILTISFLFFLPQKADAQAGVDCRKIFDKAMSQCTKDFNKCLDACSKETEKPDGTAYFNSGEIFTKCMKASDCDGKSSACNEQSLSNLRTCGKSDKSTEAKKETPKQDGIRAMVGTHEIYDAARGAYINLSDFYGTVSGWTIDKITGEQVYIEPPDILNLNRIPLITKEDEQKAWEVFLPIFTPGEENITVVKGQGEMKTPTLSDFIPIPPKSGDTLQVTYLDSTLRSTSDNVQFRYAWSPDSGSVINVPQGSEIEIKFPKPVQDEKAQELKRMLKLNKGEVEIKVKNASQKDKFGVQGDFFDLFVIQTHFWVNQDRDKKLAVIGVYEGEVEVQTKDGKTIKVKPEGSKPGVIVISRKISVVKLAVIGVVLAGVAGAVAWFVKKKILKRFSKKR